MDDLRLARIVDRTAKQQITQDVVKLYKLKAMLDYIKAQRGGQQHVNLLSLEEQVTQHLASEVQETVEEQVMPQTPVKVAPKLTVDTNSPSQSPAQSPTLSPRSGGHSPNAKHDKQAEELIRMAKIIRQNVEGVQQIIKRDRQVIESTAGLLEGNQMQLGREGERLRRFNQDTWISWWRLLLIALASIIVFIVMFMFISFTKK